MSSLVDNRGSDGASSVPSPVSSPETSYVLPDNMTDIDAGLTRLPGSSNVHHDPDNIRWRMGMETWDNSHSTQRQHLLEKMSSITSKPPELVEDLVYVFKHLAVDGTADTDRPYAYQCELPASPGRHVSRFEQQLRRREPWPKQKPDHDTRLLQVGSEFTRTTHPTSEVRRSRGDDYATTPRSVTFPLAGQPSSTDTAFASRPWLRNYAASSMWAAGSNASAVAGQPDAWGATTSKRPPAQAAGRKSKGGGVAKRSGGGGGPKSKKGARTSLDRASGDGEDGEDDEDGDAPKKKRCEPVDKADVPAEDTYACPFAKQDPARHLECLKLSLGRIKDVKQHLYRKHKEPAFFCNRCWHYFKTRDALNAHRHPTAPLCAAQPTTERHWMSSEQEDDVRERSSQQLTHAEQWYAIFAILFDVRVVARPASPYNVRADLFGFLMWMNTEGIQVARSLAAQTNGSVEDTMSQLPTHLIRTWGQRAGLISPAAASASASTSGSDGGSAGGAGGHAAINGVGRVGHAARTYQASALAPAPAPPRPPHSAMLHVPMQPQAGQAPQAAPAQGQAQGQAAAVFHVPPVQPYATGGGYRAAVPRGQAAGVNGIHMPYPENIEFDFNLDGLEELEETDYIIDYGRP